MPLHLRRFLIHLAIALALLILGVAGARRIFGSLHTLDIAGATLCSMLTAYLVHLLPASPRRQSSSRISRVGEVILRITLCLVFASAASYKYLHFSEYGTSAVGLGPQWLPAGGVRIVIAALPGFEAVVAVLFLCPRFTRHAMVLSTAFLVVMTALAVAHYESGQFSVPCGCNWPFLKVLTPERLEFMVLRNVVLLAGILVLWRKLRMRKSDLPGPTP